MIQEFWEGASGQEFRDKEFRDKEFRDKEFRDKEFRDKEFRDKEFRDKEFRDKEFRDKEFRDKEFRDKEFRDKGVSGQTKLPLPIVDLIADSFVCPETPCPETPLAGKRESAASPDFDVVKGRYYLVDSDDEMCPRCATVDKLAVPLLDMNLDRRGMKATCPQCETAIGNRPPISRPKQKA